MLGLLAVNKIVVLAVVGGIVGVIVLSVAMHFINREFRIRYDLNLIGGGLLMLLAGGAIAGGALLIKADKKVFGFILFAVAAALLLITLIYDCKKCGGAGILALFCQTLFCVPALFLILELFTGRSTNLYRDYRREERDIARARERRGYTDRGYDDYDDRRRY